MATIEGWLIHLYERDGTDGRSRLRPNTIRTYKAAMHTQWEIEGHVGDNPWAARRLYRMIDGMKRERDTEGVDARTAKPPSFELTPPMIVRIAPQYQIGDEWSELTFAAITMGTGALLRPGELLGARRRRPLQWSAISFGDDSQERDAAWCATHTPTRYWIRLGSTKADQGGTNPPVVVGNRMAVDALWQWRQRTDGTIESEIFTYQRRRLTSAALVKSVERALTVAGIPHGHITGKAFRRGGASHQLAKGVSIPAIMRAGRWRTARIIDVYASAAAQDERCINESATVAESGHAAPLRRNNK